MEGADKKLNPFLQYDLIEDTVRQSNNCFQQLIVIVFLFLDFKLQVLLHAHLIQLLNGVLLRLVLACHSPALEVSPFVNVIHGVGEVE